jgi:hypothetical protein
MQQRRREWCNLIIAAAACERLCFSSSSVSRGQPHTTDADVVYGPQAERIEGSFDRAPRRHATDVGIDRYTIGGALAIALTPRQPQRFHQLLPPIDGVNPDPRPIRGRREPPCKYPLMNARPRSTGGTRPSRAPSSAGAARRGPHCQTGSEARSDRPGLAAARIVRRAIDGAEAWNGDAATS